MISRVGLLSLLFVLPAIPVFAAAEREPAPEVVVTIKPIHSLVLGVMEGVAEPELLLPGNVSPHTFSLKPSLIRRIRDADMVVWVGPGLENPLQRIIRSHDNAITLIGDKRLKRLDVRREGVWQHADHDSHGHSSNSPGSHDHEEHEHHKQSKQKSLLGLDSHLWLSVENAIQVTTIIEQALIQLAPHYSVQFKQNAQRQRETLAQLKLVLEQKLSPIKEHPYAVMHDGYHYFEDEFGLNAVGAVMFDPARPASAKRLVDLKHSLKHQQAVCIFSEPQLDQKKVHLLAQQLGLKTAVLDPLGVNIPAGKLHYAQTMTQLTDVLAGCLSQP